MTPHRSGLGEDGHPAHPRPRHRKDSPFSSPPELPAERCFYKFRKCGVVVRGHNMTVQPRGSTSNRNLTAGTRGRTASNQNIVSLIPPGKFLHDLQRIIPERIDLHRFSVARGGNPVTDTHVHPGDLVKTASGMMRPSSSI